MSQTTILRPRATVGPTLQEADGSSMTFDAIVSESPSREGSLTKHPVEDGADVSDHFQPEPVSLSLIVNVTNSPLPSQGLPEQNRDISRFKDLLEIWKRGEPITVVTGLDVYLNMVVLRVNTTKDPSSGQAIAINVDLEEVILTTTETVDVPPSKARRKAGRQNPEAVKEAEDALAQMGAAANVSQAGSGGTGEANAATAQTQQTVVTSAAQSGPAQDPEANAVQDKQTATRAGALNGK